MGWYGRERSWNEIDCGRRGNLPRTRRDVLPMRVRIESQRPWVIRHLKMRQE